MAKVPSISIENKKIDSIIYIWIIHFDFHIILKKKRSLDNRTITLGMKQIVA